MKVSMISNAISRIHSAVWIANKAKIGDGILTHIPKQRDCLSSLTKIRISVVCQEYNQQIKSHVRNNYFIIISKINKTSMIFQISY